MRCNRPLRMVNELRGILKKGAFSMIIDTHTHFYDPFRPQGVPWPEKDDEIL